MIQKRAFAALALSVLTVHVFVLPSKTASLTRVLNSTSRLRSKRPRDPNLWDAAD